MSQTGINDLFRSLISRIPLHHQLTHKTSAIVVGDFLPNVKRQRKSPVRGLILTFSTLVEKHSRDKTTIINIF